MKTKENPELEKWLEGRPQIIKDMARQYPTGWYVMTNNAPYGISTPKTKVELIGYKEGGEVIVLVHPEHRTDDSLLHEADLRIKHPNHTSINTDIIRVVVEVKYIKPIKNGD